jgi:ligand-binding sensor domain-containing protein/class 3 adenylate cyclase/predicted metal-dependent HD superfamily phosphohydrolase
MFRLLFTTTLSILCVTAVFGQSKLRFRNYTINDGLSQSSVTCILQDNLHSFWIGTQDGLNRYDGRSFEIFTSGETPGLESEYIRCAEKDSEGNIWFGTNNGLTKYDISKEEFSTYSPQQNIIFQIEDISVGNKGHIWITTAEHGLYEFSEKNKKFKSLINIVPSKKTTNVSVLNSGDLIVSTNDQGIFICDDQLMQSRKIKLIGKGGITPHVNKIRLLEESKVLLATNQGVYELNIKTKSSQKKFKDLGSSFENLNVTDVYNTEVGWIIATNGNGLLVVDKNNQHSQYTEDIFQKNALLFNELNTIYNDNAGTIWIGSQRGLSSFDPSYRGILGVGPSGNPDKGIPTASVWSLSESEDGKYVYIGTDKGISRLNRHTGQYKQFYRTKEHSTIGTGEMAVLSMMIISKNRVLVGCADGFFELNIHGDSYTFEQVLIPGTEGTLKHKRAYSIVNWKENKCFIGTKDGVLLYNYKTREIRTFEHDPKKQSSTISKGVCRLVYKDRNDRIWFATSTGGLNILSERDDEVSIRPYEWNTIIKTASKDYVSSIYHDNNGNYWYGTLGSGLIKWNEKSKKTESYNKTHGLPNDVIYGVVADDNGNLWLSTNKGLSSFSIKNKKAKNYTEIHGLMSNEFNLGAFMKTNEGELFFGGIYGYNYFNPSELSNSQKDIGIIFTKFKLENEWLKPGEEGSPLSKPIFETKEIRLSHRHSSFTLRFQPSDISNPELINYKYVLEGSEEGEILIGNLNEIHFNALAPGDYELKIYARLGDGSWSTVPARMKVYVSSPFWRTWWFWLIVAAFLAVFIRIFIRRRIDAARREQIRLEIKVKNRTREIQKQNEKIEAQKLKIEEEKNKVLKQQKLLQVEKDKTEKLLKNVIPESTAEELKKKGRARARGYKTVSVLFTDFVGFTKISDRMTASELVKKLDVYFTKFDQIIVKNNLEKIKTIGDAYMCAGGVPVRNSTNPIDTCLAALQIQAYMQKRKNDAIANNGEYWELRLGINTGEVTAGVIGSERLAYDIWGATVNQAQRMEMLGEPGKVTITGATYQHIEPYFECTFKGKAQSKSRGLLDMYIVERIKPELSLKGEGIVPNARFQEIVNLHLYSSINYYKAERHIMRLLEQDLSKNLHYHSVAHSKDVVNAVEHLALMENVTDEALFLLKSAANYHDAGFVEQYDNNEPVGARMAGEILPKYGYTEEHIKKIQELIYATKIPHEPKNKWEEIICDADLDYLGRDDFHEIADKLRLELREHGKISSDRQWDEIQVNFLKSHKYFTKTAKKTRRKKKMQNLQEVIERLERDDYKD